MNQKKSSKLLIIMIIIVITIVIVGGVIIVSLATDIFKSDKELFFKYITQMGDVEKGFVDNSLKQYLERRKTTPYINEGTFSTNINSKEIEKDILNKINDFNISFSGQVDTTNSKSTQEISLNYSNDVKFPINYKQIENTIGVQTNYIGNKFVAVETDKLENIGIDNYSNIAEELQKITKVEISDEVKNNIQSTYKDVLNKNLQDEKFSKIKDSNGNGYRLSLEGEELKNIIIQLLETLKNDKTTLDKINEYLKTYKNSAKIKTSDIESIIKSIEKNSELEDEKCVITVYNKNGETSKIEFETNQVKVSIQKEKEKDNIKYSVSVEIKEEETLKIYLNLEYSGLSALRNVQENYELGLETEDIGYKYQLKNQINFTDTVSIEDFTEQNSMILTNYSEENVNNFLGAVKERIAKVNKQQMEQLGLEESENPIIYTIMLPTVLQLTNAMGESMINQEMNEAEIKNFNDKFEIYEGTNIRGTTVKGLMSVIMNNNTMAENREQSGTLQIKEIHFEGQEYDATEQNIALIKTSIETTKAYKVEFEKDQDTGIIYRAVINSK